MGVIVMLVFLYSYIMAKASEKYVEVQKKLGVKMSFNYERNIWFASLSFGYTVLDSLSAQVN